MIFKNQLTNSICNDDDMLEILQNSATLRDRLAKCNVLNGIDNKRMKPYSRPFLRQSCLGPGTTQRPLCP